MGSVSPVYYGQRRKPINKTAARLLKNYVCDSSCRELPRVSYDVYSQPANPSRRLYPQVVKPGELSDWEKYTQWARCVCTDNLRLFFFAIVCQCSTLPRFTVVDKNQHLVSDVPVPGECYHINIIIGNCRFRFRDWCRTIGFDCVDASGTNLEVINKNVAILHKGLEMCPYWTVHQYTANAKINQLYDKLGRRLAHVTGHGKPCKVKISDAKFKFEEKKVDSRSVRQTTSCGWNYDTWMKEVEFFEFSVFCLVVRTQYNAVTIPQFDIGNHLNVPMTDELPDGVVYHINVKWPDKVVPFADWCQQLGFYCTDMPDTDFHRIALQISRLNKCIGSCNYQLLKTSKSSKERELYGLLEKMVDKVKCRGRPLRFSIVSDVDNQLPLVYS